MSNEIIETQHEEPRKTLLTSLQNGRIHHINTMGEPDSETQSMF